MSNDKFYEELPEPKTETNPTDEYDSLFADNGSVGDALSEVLQDDKVREAAAQFIINIEKRDGEDIQAKLALANMLVDKVTDEVWRVANLKAEGETTELFDGVMAALKEIKI